MATKPEIVDVRIHHEVGDISKQIIGGLLKPVGSKSLPTLLLYDERGLRLYDDITIEVPEYYLFGAEEEILKNYVDDIINVMHSRGTGGMTDEVVLELGAGALRKTSLILLGLSRLISTPSVPAPITYYALDLEERELDRTLGQIATSELGQTLQGKVKAKGMWGTYDGGLKFVREGGLLSQVNLVPSPYELHRVARDTSPSSSTSTSSDVTETDITSPSTPESSTQPPLHILFLGSSLGNFSRREGADFLRSLPLRPGSGDTLLLGMDHDNDRDKIEEAYNDRGGYTKRFIMNGLRAAGRALGDDSMFDEDKWEYVNRYNVEERRHEAYYKSKCAQTLQGPASQQEMSFLADELVNIEVSHKFSEVDTYILFTEANLRPIQRWTDSALQYSLWLLERPPFIFPLLSSPRACNSSGSLVLKESYSSSSFGVPSFQDWENLWTTWDFITLRMIPPSMLFQKPIDLRHICLFYFGHIPTFLDIHLSRLLEEPHTEPDVFKYIFERGIDPIVDDPNQCHPHSEVPQSDEDWPSLNTILGFQSRVRERLLKLYEEIDSGKRTMTKKIGRVLFMTFEHEAMHTETILYMLLQRAGTGTISPPDFTPPPWTSLAALWDAAPEPKFPTVTLGPATISQGHDDTEADSEADDLDFKEHEFGWDNEHPKREIHVDEFSIEWRPVTNGQFYNFYQGSGMGKVQLPASWVYKDGEIEVRTLYGPVPMKIAQHWPILTSYNDLSTYASVKGGRIPTEPELRLFLNKFESGYEGGANVGFRNWHPIPATTGGESNRGRGHNGGVWEWTSTVFDTYDGFVPSVLYPGYSMDFFDNLHQTVIGGSYATIPRIAERRTMRNWYQRNYAYSWVSARIAYDVSK